MAAPLVVRLVMDAVGYLKTVDTAVASNTKLEQSSLGVGEAMQVSANKSVAASLRATEALETQIAGYRQLAVAANESAVVRERASLLADRAQGRLNSSLGLTTAASLGMSNATKTGERDLGKFTRGALAGSGAASSLGRSLAFASTGFIAIAGTSTIIASSIKAALDLQKTQRQTDQQLQTGGKSWFQYGQQIEQADLKLSHVSGFTNQELLQSFTGLFRVTGNVSRSLQLNAVAADVARGRNISLASASNALAKAAAGSFSSLRKLNIIVPQGSTVLQALTFVAQKYAGQAAAGATVSDKFHASMVAFEEVIGTALLPAFTRVTTAITDWLARMTESGKAQRDVNKLVSIGGAVFHTLGGIIHGVDVITGSFGNTLKILFELLIGREIIRAVVGVDKLAASWLGVAGAANTAAAAEEKATVAGAGAGAAGVGVGAAGGGLVGGLAARRAAQQATKSEALVGRITKFTGTMVPAEEAVAGVGAAAVVASGKIATLRAGLLGLGTLAISAIAIPIVLNIRDKLSAQTTSHGFLGKIANDFLINNPLLHPERAFHDFVNFGRYGPSGAPVPVTVTNLGPAARGEPGGARFLGPGGVTSAPASFKSFTDPLSNQLAQARAAMTKTIADDVAAAKDEISIIKRMIAAGHFRTTAALISALQAEASAQGVLDSARQAAAQQAAAIAAAKKAAASTYSTPIDLQLAEARAQLTTATTDDIAAEKKILAAAKAAVAAGKKNKQGQLAALQIELQAQQALASLQQQSATTFTQSLRLQLALAKAQATGADITPILKREKAALLKALKAAKGNIQKQIDIYNQIAAINQQMQSSVTNAYGDYKKASVKALTANLALTAAQRRELEQRLSQRGPGGTVPATGVGAAGYIIGPDGRPIHRHRRPRHGGDSGGSGNGSGPSYHPTFIINVELDGEKITRKVTINQQRHRRRNPSSRRGPNAGSATS